MHAETQEKTKIRARCQQDKQSKKAGAGMVGNRQIRVQKAGAKYQQVAKLLGHKRTYPGYFQRCVKEPTEIDIVCVVIRMGCGQRRGRVIFHQAVCKTEQAIIASVKLRNKGFSAIGDARDVVVMACPPPDTRQSREDDG